MDSNIIINELNNEFSKYRTSKEQSRKPSLTTAIVRKTGSKYFRKYNNPSKEYIYNLSEHLLNSKNWPNNVIAFDFLFRMRKDYEEKDFKLFEKLFDKHVTNWGPCDDFCTHAFGELIYQYESLLKNISKWKNSDNNMFRRAYSVILVYSVRRKKYIKQGLKHAKMIFNDEDMYVQKGAGWLLKEISNVEPETIYNFIEQHKHEMPRLVLRYAIEKFDAESRRVLMSRD